jgi:hypothetical protein
MYYVLVAVYLALFAAAEWKRDVIYAVSAMLAAGIAMMNPTLMSATLFGVDTFNLPLLMFIAAGYCLIRMLLTNAVRVQ